MTVRSCVVARSDRRGVAASAAMLTHQRARRRRAARGVTAVAVHADSRRAAERAVVEHRRDVEGSECDVRSANAMTVRSCVVARSDRYGVAASVAVLTHHRARRRRAARVVTAVAANAESRRAAERVVTKRSSDVERFERRVSSARTVAVQSRVVARSGHCDVAASVAAHAATVEPRPLCRCRRAACVVVAVAATAESRRAENGAAVGRRNVTRSERRGRTVRAGIVESLPSATAFRSQRRRAVERTKHSRKDRRGIVLQQQARRAAVVVPTNTAMNVATTAAATSARLHREFTTALATHPKTVESSSASDPDFFSGAPRGAAASSKPGGADDAVP